MPVVTAVLGGRKDPGTSVEAYCHLLVGMFTEGGCEPGVARSKKFLLWLHWGPEKTDRLPPTP